MAHVVFAEPVSPLLVDYVEAVARAENVPLNRGGTYLGAAIVNLGQSRLYRSWGCDVIGMTNMLEARLAREAELCYASVAMGRTTTAGTRITVPLTSRR